MLKADQVYFRYEGTSNWIVECLDLSFEPGEIVGLSGPSGKGKATLAKLLAGFYPPTLGKVTIDHQPLPTNGFNPVQLIFQHPELVVNPRWKVKKILAEAYSPSVELMDMLSINETWLERFPHELSGGEIQRIAVARALAPETRYLIADEMTSMLDAITQAQIWQAILNHSRQHQLGILVISHDLSLLERLCSRILIP